MRWKIGAVSGRGRPVSRCVREREDKRYNRRDHPDTPESNQRLDDSASNGVREYLFRLLRRVSSAGERGEDLELGDVWGHPGHGKDDKADSDGEHRQCDDNYQRNQCVLLSLRILFDVITGYGKDRNKDVALE